MQFQAGETRNISGVTYTRQADGRWTAGGNAQPRLVPMPGYSPDPFKAQDQQQDLTKGGIDIQRGEVGLDRDRLALERERIELEKARAGTEEKKASVEQGKAAGFHSRAVKSNQAYNLLGIGAPTIGREGAQAILPDNVVNAFTGPERQQAEALEKDFIAATLRYESGAAIPPEELETQRRIFFPVAGDSAETMQLKARLRDNVIAALEMGAGGAAIDVPAIADETVRGELEQRIARGDTPQDTIKWLVGIGRPPTPEQIDRIFANAGNTDPRVLPPEGGTDPRLRAFGVGVRGVLQGVGDVANVVSSPFIAGINAATGSNLNPDMGQNLGDFFGLPEPQSNAENIAFQVDRFGTGALNLAGAARAASPFVAGATGNALSRFGGAPLTDAVAGSVGGAASEGTRQLGGGPVLQTVAGIGAGAASIPASSRINALMNPIERPVPSVVRAGQQEGVTVNRAMVDPGAEQRVTAVGKTMVGGRRMQRDMREIGGQIQARVQRLGRNEEAVGEAMDPAVAGQTVQAASERFIKTSGQKLGRRYDALEREVGDLKVPPTLSLQRVDEAIARLSELGATNGEEIKYLQRLKSDLGKDLSVGALRRLRTTLRKRISKGELTFGEDEATVLSIMDTASEDIANGLAAAGKRGVAERFRRVDADYRDRMEFISGTVQKIIGKRGANLPAGKVMENLKALTSPKGDNAGFARLMREMAPEEQADIAATLAEALGKNADGEFSTAFLVKHLEKMPRAVRVAAFGPDGARSLDNLEQLAREHKHVTRALGGSPTGVANDYRSYLLNLVLGGGTFATTGADLASAATGAAVAGAGVAIKSGRDLMNARLLMSPDIQKWLRSAPRTRDPKAINSHFDRLKAIATRHPALAEEIQQFQQMMMRAANENAAQTGRVAASPNERPEDQAGR